MEAATGANAKRPWISPRPLADDDRSIAAGADTHAHAGSIQDNAVALPVVALALDVTLAGRGVAVGLAQDDASLTALTPAAAGFIADQANVLDVAVRGSRLTASGAATAAVAKSALAPTAKESAILFMMFSKRGNSKF